MTNYLENKLIDHLFRGVPYTAPAGLYAALFTGAPSDAGGGTEASGAGYGRVNVAPSATAWAATDAPGSTAAASGGTSGTTSNNGPVNFPTPSGSWGLITHVGIYDQATGGNLLFYGAVGTPRTVSDAGTPASFPAAALSYQIDT